MTSFTATAKKGSETFAADSLADSFRGFAADGADTVTYAGAAAGITLSFAAADQARVAKPVNGVTLTDTLAGIGQVVGTAFGDVLNGSQYYPAGGLPFLMTGGAGNDTIRGYGNYWNVADYGTSAAGIVADMATGIVADGLSGTDTLIGIVSIRGSAHADTLTGGNGTWLLMEGMAGNDTLNGKGLVANGVSYAASRAGVSLDLGAGTASDGWGGTDTLIGVVRAMGSAQADLIRGGGADDWLQGSFGNDTLDGGAGANTLDYNTVSGSVRVLLADDGAGRVVGTVQKAVGTDGIGNFATIQGSYGSDLLKGVATTTQTVYLRGLVGQDTIDGAGNVHNVADYAGSSVPVTIDLALGQVRGAIGPDTLVRVAAVRGSWGDDTVLASEEGSFTVDGGGGSDTLDYSGTSSGIIAYLAATSGASGTINGTVYKSGGGLGLGAVDTFTSVSRIIGSAGDDDLEGSTSTAGLDVIRLTGGAGDDVINGQGSALNRADYGTSTGGVTVHLQDFGNGTEWTGSASDGLGGTDELDNVLAVYGSSYADSIVGSGQNDVVQGWYGNDTLDGGAGIDTALYWCLKSQASWTRNTDGSFTVVTPYGTDQLTNIETLQFRDASVALNVITHDFNRDGKADLLMQDAAGRLVIWTMDGATVAGTPAVPGAPLAGSRAVAVGDVNGDGVSDIVLSDSQGHLTIWTMNFIAGSPTRSDTGTLTVAAATRVNNVGDYTGEGKADLLLQAGSKITLETSVSNGTTYSPAAYASLTSNQAAVGYGDFNADGRTDMLVQATLGSTKYLSVMFTAASGSNYSSIIGGFTLGTSSVAGVGDFNGDGRADILLVDASNALTVKTMNGNVITGSVSLGTMAAGWTVAQVVDLDGDSKADVVTRHALDATRTEWDATFAAESGGTFTWHAIGTTLTGEGWSLV